jgi:hypothetical protein
MHENPTPAEEDGQIDSVVLGLLVYPESQRPMSKDEIERTIGEDATDSLNRLYGAGLVHRLDRFVWATRAAVVSEDIAL